VVVAVGCHVKSRVGAIYRRPRWGQGLVVPRGAIDRRPRWGQARDAATGYARP
jgi:hypothetical protein